MRVPEIWINCTNDETADSIADTLIDLRLAACANKHQPVESSYRWNS